MNAVPPKLAGIAPDTETPQWGAAQCFGGVRWELVEAGANQVHYCSNEDAITFSVSHQPDKAFGTYNSDKAHQFQILPKALHFHEHGSHVYCQWQQMQLAILNISSEFRERLSLQLNLTAGQFGSVINNNDPVSQGLNSLVRQYVAQPHLLNTLALESVAVLAYQNLASWQLGRGPSSSSYRAAKQRFAVVVDYIQAHLGDDLSLVELAGVANMSLHHFSRTFKQAIGQTPHQYITEQRLERARRLIGNTRLPLAQIALDCGFASQSHLTQAFKRRFGVTPSSNRRVGRSTFI